MNDLGLSDNTIVVLSILTIILTLGYIFWLRIKDYKSPDSISSPQIPKEQNLDIETLHKIKETKIYLDERLTILFDDFIINRLLFIFKQYGSISIENVQKTKLEFIDIVEASLTEFEKSQFQKAFDSFTTFKLHLVNFYNIKLIKLQLLVTHKLDLNENEFKDTILINSLSNDISKKDMKTILDTIGISN